MGSRWSRALGAPHEWQPPRILLEGPALCRWEHRASNPVRAREGLLDRLGGGAWQAKKGPPEGPHPRGCRQAHPHRRRTGSFARARCSNRPSTLGCVFRPGFPTREDRRPLCAIEDVLADLTWGTSMEPAHLRRCGVSARPRWRCARLSSQPFPACRSPSSRRRRSLRASTQKSFAERFRGFSGGSASALALRRPEGRRQPPARGLANRHGRHRSSAPTRCSQAGEVSQPRAARHRRGAAFRRLPQGAAEGECALTSTWLQPSPRRRSPARCSSPHTGARLSSSHAARRRHRDPHLRGSEIRHGEARVKRSLAGALPGRAELTCRPPASRLPGDRGLAKAGGSPSLLRRRPMSDGRGRLE